MFSIPCRAVYGRIVSQGSEEEEGNTKGLLLKKMF